MSFPTLQIETSTDGLTWELRSAARPQPLTTLSDGLPPRMGSATILEAQPDTRGSYLGDGSTITEIDAIAVGAYVRVLAITGFDADAVAQTTLLWQGVVSEMALSMDATERAYQCRTCGFVLDQYRVTAGYCLDTSGASFATLDEWPVFNRGGIGNRSSAQYTLITGHDIYVTDPGSGTLWTAQTVAETLLTQLNVENADAVPWSLAVGSGADELAAAARSSEWDLRGKTLWEALGMLFSGWCQWTIVPGASAITVQLGATESVIVDGSPREVVLRAYDPGDAYRYDGIDVRSTERPVCTLSLYCNDADTGTMVKDWTESEQTQRAGDKNNPALAHVYTRFRLSPTWSGTSDDGTTAGPGIRDIDTDDDERAWNAGTDLPKIALMELLSHACVIDADFNAVEAEPGIWLGDDDISEHCTMYISHDQDGPIIEIIYQPPQGGLGADAIEAALEDGDDLVITIGVREPTRRLARWRSSADLPRSVPRIIVDEIPGRQWYVAPAARMRSVWDTTTGIVLEEGDLTAYRDWLYYERYGPNAPAANIAFEVMNTIDPAPADLPQLGDQVNVSGTRHGLIGPSRLVERSIMLDDPAYSVRYRCSRDAIDTEARVL